MLRKNRRVLLGLLAVLVLAVLVLIAFTAGRPPARPPLPNPNGYDDLIKAGEALHATLEELLTLDQPGLADLVRTNVEALRLLRLGLSRPCARPLVPSLTNGARIDAMYRLAALLAAEGRLREMDNRPAEAALSYVDATRFGNEISRGGELIDRLVGMNSERVGYHGLAKLAPLLDPGTARLVVTALEAADANRVEWSQVLRAAKDSDRQFIVKHPLSWAFLWWFDPKALDKAATRHKIVVARVRLVAAELALRRWRVEQGHPPTRLEDLVPKYLGKVPEDPFSGRPLIYRPQGTNWLLYSIGPDGVDNGGRPAAPGWPVKGDLGCDSPW